MRVCVCVRVCACVFVHACVCAKTTNNNKSKLLSFYHHIIKLVMLFLKIQVFLFCTQHQHIQSVCLELTFEYHSLFQTCHLFTDVVLVKKDRSIRAVVFTSLMFMLQWFSACSC